MKLCAVFPLVLLLSAAPALSQGSVAYAPNYKDGVNGEEIQSLAQAAMEAANVAGHVTISSRRNYPPCASTPVVQPNKGKWSLLTVSCHGKSSWTRHVRTSVKSAAFARADSKKPLADGTLVAVLNKSLKRGAVITANDLTMKPVSASAADGSYTNPAHVIGQRLAKNLGEGRPVQARHLEKNWMITEDTPVAIEFLSGGMAISTPGKSLENGELGDLVRVQNMSSGRVLTGLVSGPQKITVRAKTH